MFLFFSDGILDARTREGDLFGSGRVEKLVEQNTQASAQQMVDLIYDAVSSHAGEMEAFDDQTIVALKVKGKSSAPPAAKSEKRGQK
jgi:serine phosphatase RsbU (regulator of sigma subunit)